MAGSRVRGLTITLNVDGTEALRQLTSFENASKRVGSALKDVNKLLKLDPTNITLIKQKQDLLKDAISKTKTQLDQEKAALKHMDADGVDKTSEKYRGLQRQIEETKRKLQELKSEHRDFGSVAGQFVQGVGSQMQALGGKIQDAGNNIISMGRDLERISAPFQAAFAFAIKTGAEFEGEMAKVKAVTGATGEEFELLESTAREAGRTTVFSASEAADALYYMGLAGWDAEESQEALGGVLNLAAAGELDLARASDIVTDGMTAMGVEVDGYTDGVANAEHYTNVLAAAMSNSNTTVDLLGESFKYAAPMAGSLEYSVEDLTLALGLMASAGVKGSQAGTGLKQALKQMSNPTQQQAEAMERFGISMFDSYGNAIPLRDVMEQFRDEFGGLNLELVDAEGNLKTGEQLMEEYGDSLPTTQMEKFQGIVDIVGVRALPGMLGVVNASEEDWDQLVGAVDGANEAYVRHGNEIYTLQEAFDTFGEEVVRNSEDFEIMGAAEGMAAIELNTLKGDTQLFKDALADLGIEIFNMSEGPLRDLVQGATNLIQKFTELSPKTKSIIVIIGGVVAALGPVTLAIGSVVRSVGTLISFGGMLVQGIGFLISPVGAVIAALAVVGVIVYEIIKHWEGFKEFFVTLWDGIKLTFEMIWEGIKAFALAIWEGIKTDFENAWAVITDAATAAWQIITDLASAAWWLIQTVIIEPIQAIVDGAIALWDGLVAFFTTTWNGIQTTATTVWNAISKFFTTTWNAIKTAATTIWNAIKTFFSNTWTGIKTVASAIWNGIKTVIINPIQAAWNTIKSVVNGIKTTISNVFNSVKSTVTTVWNAIKRAITHPIETAKDVVKTMIDKIKGFFNFKWELPKLKLPHFSVSGSANPINWLKEGVPKISVEWYAKAMDKGMVLDGATIFGFNGNSLLGGGEAGREVIIGQRGLQSMITAAVGANQLSPATIYAAVRAGMEAADVAVYMDGQKVTRQITKTITANQQSSNRYFGAY